MKYALSLASILVGLGIANCISAVITEMDFAAVFERTFFQGIALVSVWLMTRKLAAKAALADEWAVKVPFAPSRAEWIATYLDEVDTYLDDHRQDKQPRGVQQWIRSWLARLRAIDT